MQCALGALRLRCPDDLRSSRCSPLERLHINKAKEPSPPCGWQARNDVMSPEGRPPIAHVQLRKGLNDLLQAILAHSLQLQLLPDSGGS